MQDQDTAKNPAAESPTAADTAPVEPAEQDAAEESSTSTDASEDSSPAQGAKPKSLSDIISKALGPAEDDPDEEEAPASPPEEKADQAETASDDEPEAKQEEPAKEEKKEAEFDERSLSAKAQKRFRELANEAKELRGIVDELRRYAGDDDGWRNMRQLIRDHAENPAEAVPMLEMLLDDARKRAGLVVQSDDIKRKLDDGLVDEPTALELEQARVEKQRIKAQQEAQKASQAQAEQQAMVKALDQWEVNVKARLPDYDSYQGLVRAKLSEAAMRQMPRTPDEAVQMAQSALDDVTGWVKQRLAPKVTRKVATSSGSSAKATAKPKSIRDLIDKRFPG